MGEDSPNSDKVDKQKEERANENDVEPPLTNNVRRSSSSSSSSRNLIDTKRPKFHKKKTKNFRHRPSEREETRKETRKSATIERQKPEVTGCHQVCNTLIFEVYKLLRGKQCDCY